MKLPNFLPLTLLLIATALAQVTPPPAVRMRAGLPSAAPEPPAQPAEEPGRAADVAGAWKGLYFVESTGMLMDMDLKAAEDGRALTGEIRFTTVVGQWQRRGAYVGEGSWRVQEQYFPGSRTIALVPQGWIKQPTVQTPIPQQMGGVFSAQRNELAGQIVNGSPRADATPSFLFVRADGQAGAAAAAKITKLAESAAALEPMLRPVPGTVAPDDNALLAWAARYEQEYPGSGGKHPIEKVCNQAMPLLNDATFKPLFGDAYDSIDPRSILKACDRFAGRAEAVDPVERMKAAQELQAKIKAMLEAAKTPEERAAVQARLGPMMQAAVQASLGAKPDPRLRQSAPVMQYVLAPAALKIVGVAAMRAIDAWQVETLARFAAEPAKATTFADLAAAQQAVTVRAAYAWPSDRKKTDDAFEQLRTKLAGPALAASSDRAIATAAGLPGAKSLMAWAGQNKSALEHASPADRAAAIAKVDAAVDKLLQEQLAAPLAQLDKLGTGVAAAYAGAAWHQDIQSRFGFALDRPAIQAAIAKLKARRAQDLASAESELVKAIAACAKGVQVDEIVQFDFSVPGDKESKTYQVVMAAAAARKKQVAEADLLALFSEDERRIMDRPGHLDLSKAKEGPPSAEEIRLALVRGYAANEGGRIIDPNTARHVARAQSVLFIPYPLTVNITNEKRLDWAQLPKSKDYKCTFQVLLKLQIAKDNVIANYDANTRKGSDQMAELANKLSKLSETDDRVMVFRLYEDGWGVPDLREGAAIEDAMMKALTGH
ncbi:MAG: hypothetical protein NTW19_14710 [Planctomycetota bacterium]|nr:hypothetical protein [Planctomycetota bacterium]